MKKNKKRIYALYKGDTYVIDGTKEELAEYLGVKTQTIEFYISPTYEKRGKTQKSNRKKVIYLGEENE